LAHCGGPKLWKQTAQKFLSNHPQRTFKSVLNSVSRGEVVDVLEDCPDWKEALALIVTYSAKVDQDCELLGTRLMKENNQIGAVAAFVVGCCASRCSQIWYGQLKGSSSESTAESRLAKLMSIAFKTRVLGSAVGIEQGKFTVDLGGCCSLLDIESSSVFLELAFMLGQEGAFEDALRYVQSLPAAVECSYGNADEIRAILSAALSTLQMQKQAVSTSTALQHKTTSGFYAGAGANGSSGYGAPPQSSYSGYHPRAAQMPAVAGGFTVMQPKLPSAQADMGPPTGPPTAMPARTHSPALPSFTAGLPYNPVPSQPPMNYGYQQAPMSSGPPTMPPPMQQPSMPPSMQAPMPSMPPSMQAPMPSMPPAMSPSVPPQQIQSPMSSVGPPSVSSQPLSYTQMPPSASHRPAPPSMPSMAPQLTEPGRGKVPLSAEVAGIVRAKQEGAAQKESKEPNIGIDEVDVSNVPPSQMAIVSSLRDTFKKVSAMNPSPVFKKKMDDVSKKLGKLLYRLNRGDFDEAVISKLMQLSAALSAGNPDGAAEMVKKLTVDHWDQNSLWILALKRLVEASKSGK